MGQIYSGEGGTDNGQLVSLLSGNLAANARVHVRFTFLRWPV